MTEMVSSTVVQTAFEAALRRQKAGDLHTAIAAYRKLLQEEPDHFRAWHFLGVAYLQCGEVSQAIDTIRRAIALNGAKPVYHNNLGVALLAQGSLKEAKQAFVAAVALDPRYPDAVANLGLVHDRLGHTKEAATLYRNALRLQPRHVDALFNLANLLADEENPDEAIGLYHQALEVEPARSDILNNFGRALLEKGQVAEAIATFEKALLADPQRAEAAFNVGKAYAQQERMPEAEHAFAHASRLRPAQTLWRFQRLGLCPTIFQNVVDLDDYRTDLERRLDEALQRPTEGKIDDLARDAFVPSFNLAHHGRSNRGLFEKFAALFAPYIEKALPTARTKSASGKKRVGFVVTAPHVGSFLRTQGGIVERLDSARFDVVVCCNGYAMPKLRQGIRRNDVTWVPFSRGFSEAAKTVADATCDVLYFHKVSADPLGYLLPFARLAPIQCTSWTTHFTSGVPAVDYYLSSAFVEAPDADREYTEQLVRMDAFPGFERRPDPVPASCRADFGLPTQGSLYLCPQRLAKFHPAHDELFRRILDEDSTGTLIMLAGNNESVLAQLLGRLRRTLGTAARRLMVLPPQSVVRLAQLMSVCDALLDIRHYSVSLMAKDAMAAGLPIVSWPGQFKVERYTLGFYRKLGIADLIANSAEDYVRLALRLGKDADFRRDIQKRIQTASHCIFEDHESVLDFERFVEDAKPRQPN